MTTPPGVTKARAMYGLDVIDPAVGPAGWVLREDGSLVCWGHAGIWFYDLDAYGCSCKCHQPDLLTTPTTRTTP